MPILKGSAIRIDVFAVFMGVLFALIWSSAFTVGKIALADAPPFLLQSVRFLVAGLIGVALAAALGQRMPVEARQWRMIAWLGLCQNTLYLGLMFVALRMIPAGLAAILASTMPLMVAAVGACFLRERSSAGRIIGMVLGFGGAGFIMLDRLGGGGDPLGIFICMLSVMSLAAATLIARHANLGTGLFMVVGLQQLFGGLALAPFALATESFGEVTVTASLVVCFIYMTLVAGLFATFLWFSLLRRIGTQQASAYHFLNPAFGVAIAWALLGEHLGINDLIGVAVVAIGILMVQRGGTVRRPG